MKANDEGATLEKSRSCLLSDRAWLYYWRSIVRTRPRRNTYSLPKTVGNVRIFFLETSLKTHDKVGRTRSWSLLQISHKSHKHENEDKNEAPNFSLPSSSLFLILGSKGLCCFVEVLYRAIINTCLFNGVKPSEIKVKRTNKRLRSKRIKRICRFVDSVSVCIHMHTELLLNLGSCSAVTGLEGFSSLLVCFTLIICHTDISSFYRHFFIISRNILRCAPGLCSL